MSGGALRFVGWAVPVKSVEAHAFMEHGVRFSPMCADPRYRWDVRARTVRATDHDVPGLCAVCVEVVRAAARDMSEEPGRLIAARTGQLTIAEATA